MLKIFVKKWVFLLMIGVSVFFIGAKTHVGFFYLFFWFLLSSVLLSLCWIVIEYLSAGLTIERKSPSRINEDGVIEIETAIRNKGLIPVFNCVLEDNLSPAPMQDRKKRNLIEFLGRGSFLKLKYKCFCPQRGRYDIGPYTVYFFDPLSIFFFKKTYSVYTELYVLPKTFRIRSFPTLLKGALPWFGIETTHISGEDDEFYGIREYKEGDIVKRVHWISTARHNKLIVKEFQRQSFFRTVIMFNLEANKNYGQGKEKVAEYIIKIAASFSKYFLEKGISLEIIGHAAEMIHLPSNRGKEHLEEVFKIFTLAQAESKVSFGEIFEEFSRYIPNDTNLIVIMVDKDWEYLPMIMPLQKRNISLIPIILVSSTFLSSFEKHEVVKDMKIKVAKQFNFMPILFSRGDNLEATFSNIKW